MKSTVRHWMKAALATMMLCIMASLWGCGDAGNGSPLSVEEKSAEVEEVDVSKATGGTESAPFVAGELLVQTREGVGRAKLEEVIGNLGASIAEDLPSIDIKRIKVPTKALDMILAFLAKHPNIKFAEKNYIARADSIPNDGSYAYQWYLSKILAPTAWDISTGSTSISIAIADSGVDPTHPDLAAKLRPGYNFVQNNSDTHDIQTHGTQVAGAAAALSNNGVGIAGVAWTNPIVPLRIGEIINGELKATYANMANAITYAANNGIRVVNMSYGGEGTSSALQSAIDYAWGKGTIVFASAGNSANSTPQYPAACNHAVAVTATTSNDTLAYFSSFGGWVTVSAPGVSIYTTRNGGDYGYVDGTSFAAPITAGLGALILSINPNLSATQVVDIIKQNGDDLGPAGFDQSFGYGRINAYKSLIAARDTVGQTAPAAPSNLTATAVSASTINLSWTDNSGNETGFAIERKPESGGTYTQIGTVGANVQTYSDTGLPPSSKYYYRVRAMSGSLYSAYSNEQSARTLASSLAAPSGLTATAVSSSQINLSWTDNSNNETGFSIERKPETGGAYAQIATVGANIKTYSNTGLPANTKYYYRVRAVNGSIYSSYSNEKSARTLP